MRPPVIIVIAFNKPDLLLMVLESIQNQSVAPSGVEIFVDQSLDLKHKKKLMNV